MSVLHDAESESHAGTTGSTSESSFTWDHVPAGTARSALVFVFSVLSATHDDTGVTYGGVAMAAVPYDASTNSAEPGAIRAYFLDDIAAGTQAVVVSRTNNATIMYATCLTQTADSAAEVYNAGVVTRGGDVTNTGASSSGSTAAVSLNTDTYSTRPTVDDGSPGTNSLRYAASFCGYTGSLMNATGSTNIGNIDFDSYNCDVARENKAGQGARNVGFATASLTEDLALIALAVREVSPYIPATETGGTSAANTTHAITLPSAAIGDLIIAYVGFRMATYPTATWTFDASTSAFTQLYQMSDNLPNTSRSVCKYRIVQAGDSNVGATGTLTVDLSLSRTIDYSVVLIPAASWQGATPPEATPASDAGLISTFNTGVLTPSWGAGRTLWIAQAAFYQAFALTPPDNYVGFTRNGLQTAWRIHDVATEDPGTFSSNSGYWSGGTVGVRWNDATGIIGTPVFRRLLAARRRVLVP